MTVFGCSGHERNLYVFNTSTSSRLEQKFCNNNGGFLNSILNVCTGGYNYSGGCSGNNFWGSVLSGAVIALAGRAITGLFSGSWLGNCTSGLTGMCSGLSGGLSGLMGPWNIDAMIAQSPLGQVAIALEENKAAEKDLAAKIEKYKDVIDPAIKAAGQEVNTKSQIYKEVLSKCEAIKTAEPEISDEALKTRLENFTRARCYDKELTTFKDSEKESLTVAEADSVNETYNKLGKGYVELLDANTDGKVDVNEFVKYETQVVDAKDKESAEDAAITMFAVMDLNDDNYLDAKELAAYNYLTATYSDAEGESTATELTKDELGAFAEAAGAMQGEENTSKQLEMQNKLIEAAKKLEEKTQQE